MLIFLSSSIAPPGYKTYYGSVTLQSRQPFTVTPGVNGYSTSSNFKALGFLEGHYGYESTGQLSFQVGARKYQTINIDMPDFGSQGAITGLVTADAQLGNPIVGITTPQSATQAIDLLDRVLQKVNESRATMGAVTNRLNHAMDNITNVSMNTSNSRSKIEDTDYSLASSELARAQIIQQAATAVLAASQRQSTDCFKVITTIKRVLTNPLVINLRFFNQVNLQLLLWEIGWCESLKFAKKVFSDNNS
jgi:flagellin-like hook-associated protein FlgL